MNLPLPVYLPKPHICHMEQYHCCTRHSDCRLYQICSQIQKQTVCKRDCPSCTYEGCSLTSELRKNKPVYIKGVIQADRIDLNLEKRRTQEHSKHIQNHRKSYVYYNRLFGNLKEKVREYHQKYYWSDVEESRKRRREIWAKNHPKKQKEIPEKYMPECGLNCGECPHPDCVLPENWLEQARKTDWLHRNPDYYSDYYKSHKEERSNWAKAYYQEHRHEIREKQRTSRLSNPEVRAKNNEYNRKYYAEHKEEINQRRKEKKKTQEELTRQKDYQKSYREGHREEHRTSNRKYYEANKSIIAQKQHIHRQKPETKEKRAAYQTQYQKAHPEIYKNSAKKYRQNHPEKVRETRRLYYQNHKEEINAKRRAKRAAQNQESNPSENT